MTEKFSVWASLSLDNYIAPIEQYEDWTLPGRGTKRRLSCGQIKHAYSCKENHVHLHRNWCMNRTCPVCYPSWMNREAERMKDRILAFVNQMKVNIWHYTVSLDEVYSDFDNNNIGKERYLSYGFDKFRTKVFGLLAKLWRKKEGYFAVFHPYRMVRGTWRYGPHFHIITYVDFVDNKRVKELGLFVKRISRIEKVKPLLAYELGHMGIKGRKKAMFLKGSFYTMSTAGVYKSEKVALCKKCNEVHGKDNKMFKCEIKKTDSVDKQTKRARLTLKRTEEILILKKKRTLWVCDSTMFQFMAIWTEKYRNQFFGLLDKYHDPYVVDIKEIDERIERKKEYKIKERKKV